MSAPDIYNRVARRLHGLSEDWRWYSLERIGGGTLVKGAVCTAVYTRGKLKGETNWSKRDLSTEFTLVVTPEQYEAERLDWERETGKCVDCGGDGKEFAGWRRDVGALHRPCKRCSASGTAPAVSP